MLAYKRSVRVGELIQHNISKILQDIAGPDMGLITITGIKLTDDLLEARVFYSVLGSEENVKNAREKITELIPEIRHRLAMEVNLRRTPSLRFDYDDTAEKATKIFELLEHIKEQDAEPETPAPAPKKTRRKAVKPKKRKSK